MCATCGCSTRLPGPAGLAAHDHAHGDGQADDHAHADHHHAPRTPTGLERKVLARNDRLAERNRGWLAARGVLALNLVSSPGAGKTALLERTIADLAGEVEVLVIEGDQATVRDADRIRAAGARALQITTGTVCHLDAAMIGRALPELAPPPGSLVVIENVGNLVCPALFDLGERAKVLVASVPEGEDKPLKYPHLFRASQLVLLNKMDLLEHLSFDPARCAAHAHEVNPRIAVMPVSATRGDGMDGWYGWLRQRLAETRAQLA